MMGRKRAGGSVCEGWGGEGNKVLMIVAREKDRRGKDVKERKGAMQLRNKQLNTRQGIKMSRMSGGKRKDGV